MQTLTLLMIGLTLAFGGAMGALVWRASSHAMHPPRAVCAWRLGDFPGLRPQEVTVTTNHGASLSGRLFPGRSGATIVLSHGYGGCQDEMLPVASGLVEAGFSVFTYDLRGCGLSGGAVTFGAFERDDLVSVIGYLSSRRDVNPGRIGALGFSMGASITVLAAAVDNRIKAVVADSGWSDVYRWLRPSLVRAFLHPRAPFSTLSLKLVELRTGVRLQRLRPRDVIGGLSPRPILIIHGTADDVVRPTESDRNFAAAREPKEFWRIVGAAHQETIRPGGATCGQRVAVFFQQAFGG